MERLRSVGIALSVVAGLVVVGMQCVGTAGHAAAIEERGDTEEVCLCADLDGSDGNINLADFATFALCFGTPPVGDCYCADMDRDGAIDMIDFATFAQFWMVDWYYFVPNCRVFAP